MQLGHATAPVPDVLRAVPAGELVGATRKLFGDTLAIGLITDDLNLHDGFFPSTTDWVSPQPWLERLMVGTRAAEGLVVVPSMLRISPVGLVSFMNNEHALSREVLAHYGLDYLSLEKISEINPPLMARLIDLQTAAAFVGPADEAIAKSRKERTWVYRLNCPNKWGKGKFSDIAHHTIDILVFGWRGKKPPSQ